VNVLEAMAATQNGFRLFIDCRGQCRFVDRVFFDDLGEITRSGEIIADGGRNFN
jgi:hypothetical protein